MSKEPTYAELRQELDEVLERFEQGSTSDIDALLRDYEQANKLIERLENKLAQAKLTIKKVTQKSDTDKS